MIDNNNETVIYPSGRKILRTYFLYSLLILASGILLVIAYFEKWGGISQWEMIIAFTLIPIGLIFLIYSIYKIFSRQPLYIINREGIIFIIQKNKILIKWQEIDYLEISSFHYPVGGAKVRALMIYVEDSKAIYHRFEGNNQKKLPNLLKGDPLEILEQDLPRSIIEFVDLIKKYSNIKVQGDIEGFKEEIAKKRKLLSIFFVIGLIISIFYLLCSVFVFLIINKIAIISIAMSAISIIGVSQIKKRPVIGSTLMMIGGIGVIFLFSQIFVIAVSIGLPLVLLWVIILVEDLWEGWS